MEVEEQDNQAMTVVTGEEVGIPQGAGEVVVDWEMGAM